MTMLQFDYNADLDDKYREIEDALGNLRLPDDAGDPVIMQMAMDSDSVMTLSIRASSSDSLLSYIEENIVPRLENISGVSSVDVSGRTAKIHPGGTQRGGDGPVRADQVRHLERHRLSPTLPPRRAPSAAARWSFR
jgi:hypothetical protein